MPDETAPINNLWFIVPAAGSGSRFGADMPKQYLPLANSTVIETTLAVLTQLPCRGVYVGLAAADQQWQQLQWRGFTAEQRQLIRTYQGGRERCDTVLNGLLALEGHVQADDWVAVHDVARPCVRRETILGLLAALVAHPDGGLLAVAASDTMKQANHHGESVVTVDRSKLWHAQTPQVFRYDSLRHALERARSLGLVVTDEASAIEASGGKPLLFASRNDNLKITRQEDLALAEFYLSRFHNSPCVGEL